MGRSRERMVSGKRVGNGRLTFCQFQVKEGMFEGMLVNGIWRGRL